MQADKFYTHEMHDLGGSGIVYVIDREEDEHAKKIGTPLVLAEKAFTYRTPRGLKTARRRAADLCRTLNAAK